jgi:hypothetical protein
MKLIACGDSWAWGAELVDPAVVPKWVPHQDNHHLHYLPENEIYRHTHRYTGILAEKLNAEVVDLSYCGYSNDAIIRTLFDWLIKEDYLSGRDTSDIFVSIGWTSPERREFFYKQKWGSDNWMPFGPLWGQRFPENKDLDEFSRIYIENFWNPGEYMHRWINQVWQTQELLEKHKIKYVMHQAFYHHHHKMISEWEDVKYHNNHAEHITPSDRKLWDMINDKTFMHKDDPKVGTAHNYMVAIGGKDKVFADIHPNTYGHKIWAEHMYEYCTENKLL